MIHHIYHTLLLASLPTWGGVPSGQSRLALENPAAIAGEYYFERYAFRDALSLFTRAMEQPSSAQTQIAVRIAQAKLVVEGRISATGFLKSFYEQNSKTISKEGKAQLCKRWEDIASVFLTNEGQAYFLQANHKAAYEQWQQAFDLYVLADNLESHNVTILLERAKMAKKLARHDEAFNSLERLFATYLFHQNGLTDYWEIMVYFGQIDKVIEWSNRYPTELTMPIRIALGVAYALKELTPDSIAMLQPVLSKQKHVALPPIVWYAMGKNLSHDARTTPIAIDYFNQFLRSTATMPTDNNGWDPYRSQERVEETRSLIAKLR